MIRVGLTGAMAAGKSTVAERLRQHGITVIDDDVLAHEAISPGTPGHAAVVAQFGTGVVRPDQTIDRAALGRVVFADPAALQVLEGIIHPIVAQRALELEVAAGARGERLVVHDIPLLVETDQAHLFDHVLVVTAPAALRLRRLEQDRGIDPAEARRRMATQAPDEVRLAAATAVLDGSGTVPELRAQVDDWLAAGGWISPDRP